MSDDDHAVTPAQARSLARHLVGEDPTPAEVERFALAVAEGAAPLEQVRDLRLWRVATTSPTLAGLIDAGLALSEPHSPVRHRACLMLAVLEASPSHVARFEARAIGPAGWLWLVMRGGLAVARSACGLALVRSWGVLWR